MGLSSSSITYIRIAKESSPLSDAASTLGVLLDRHFNVQAHVCRVCRLAYFQLKQIADVRSFLSQGTVESLVQVFIMSKLDYCSALLYSLPDRTVTLLQRVQNAAARVMTRSYNFDHVYIATPSLAQDQGAHRLQDPHHDIPYSQ